MIGLQYCALIVSGLLNILVLMYACVLRIATTICRRHEHDVTACVEMVNDKRIYFVSHVVSKAIVNTVSGLGMMAIAVYLTVVTDICNRPFFAFDERIMFAICSLIAVCLFNIILTLLTGPLSSRKMHEIPVAVVMAVLCIAILVTKEDALMVLICLFMFASEVSDELHNLRYILQDLSVKRQGVKLMDTFRLCMHLFFNVVFPIILFSVPAWFAKESFFEMDKLSIIVFFCTVSFFVFCNSWRLKRVVATLCSKASKNNTSQDNVINSTLQTWRANRVSAMFLPIINEKLTRLVKSSQLSKAKDYMLIDDFPDMKELSAGSSTASESGGVDQGSEDRTQATTMDTIGINAVF